MMLPLGLSRQTINNEGTVPQPFSWLRDSSFLYIYQGPRVFFILTQSSLDVDMEAKTAILIQYAIFVKMEVSSMLETGETGRTLYFVH
jgi:hypothetical protein